MMDKSNQEVNNNLSLKLKKVQSALTKAYYGMFAAAFATAILGYYILQNSFVINPLTQPGITVSTIMIIFIIGSVPASLILFNVFLKKLKTNDDTAFKLEQYMKAGIIRLLVIGAGIVLGILFFYILQSQSMIFCAGIAAIALVFCKPSEVKIITDLEIEDYNI